MVKSNYTEKVTVDAVCIKAWLGAASHREGSRPEMKLESSSRQERAGGSLYRKVAAELGESNRFAQRSGGDAARTWV